MTDTNSVPRVRPRWRSLERGLPLLITALLAVLLVAALWMTHETLKRAAISASKERLESAARHLAGLATTATGGIRSRLAATARDTTILAALGNARVADLRDPRAASAVSTAQATLSRALPATSSLTMELWTADGRRIAHSGQDLRSRSPIPASAELDRPGSRPVFEGIQPSDSAQVGSLYAADSGVYFWAVAPVHGNGGRMGYLARQYQMNDGPRAEETVRGLAGSEVDAYYRNADGSLWITLGGVPVPPVNPSASVRDVTLSHRSGEPALIVEAPVVGTPLVIALEAPIRDVLAGVQRTTATLAVLSLFLLVAGAIAARLISRRVTRPLATITDAVQDIARGHYGTRVPTVGPDEMSRLAGSFNRMAEEISVAREELEMQTEEAQATAEELEQSNEELGNALAEVEEREIELRALATQAEAASRAKSEFLTVMSHELRTPLNAIGGYTELMELELRGPITEDQRRDLARIRASQKHLLGLVGAVLDLSRIESGRVTYQLEPVTLDPFLASVAALMQPQAAAKQVTLSYVPCAPEVAVTADEEKLRQVLLNLLTNAVRHTDGSGSVTLAVEAGQDRVVITVRDTGEGIEEDALERIFEPFVQLDRSLTSTREGIGLGLSISRDLARGMNGDLTVTSRVGAGSSFSVSLPRATESGVG